MSDPIITLTGTTITHDETAGLQNLTATPTPEGDANDNDIALTEVASRTPLSTTGAIGAALSGYDGTNSGLDVFTINPNGGTITNLALTGSNGAPLNGFNSGLITTDGNTIFLYTDPTNDNIVLGREGTGTTANASGNIVIAVYLEENATKTAAKLWTVQYEAISHPIAGDTFAAYDDSVNLLEKLYVTATQSQNFEFNLANAPSGQNLFIMFGDGNITQGNEEVGIVATGKNPLNQSQFPGTTITAGDTVNTSQGGGKTTFGINNQMIDEQEGIYFTFVKGPVANYTVPNLDQNEADIEGNIQFNEFLAAKAAEFQVVQLQSGKTAVVKVTAYNETQTAANASGVNFVDELNDTNDLKASITNVKVLNSDGVTPAAGVTISIVNGIATISGVKAGYIIQYTTTGDHNRVLIENAGTGTGQASADFDIGGFKLLEVQLSSATAEIGSKVFFEDDGPAITLGAVSASALTTDDQNLAINTTVDIYNNQNSAGNGTPLSNPVVATANLATILSGETFTGGTDGTKSLDFEWVVASGGAPSGVFDTATGAQIYLYASSDENTIYGRVGTSATTPNASGLIAFELIITENGDGTINGSDTVTLKQYSAIKHPDGNGDNTVSLIASALQLKGTITDGDNDTAASTINFGNAVSFSDDLPTINLGAVTASALKTDDQNLAINTTVDIYNNQTSAGNGTPLSNPVVATAKLADILTSETFSGGADGTKSLDFEWVVASGGAPSGVFDTASGAQIYLYAGPDENIVYGRVGSNATTPNATGLIAFELIITENDDGTINDGDTVTLKQYSAIKHPIANSDDTVSLIASALQLKGTITDGDNDTAASTINFGGAVSFSDDLPKLDFGDLIGTVTTATQTGFWTSSVGADSPGTLSVTASSTFDMVTPGGVSSTGTVAFNPTNGTGTLTANFDNDATNGNETIGFSLLVNSDGTYDFKLNQVIMPVVVLDTSQGQLPAGGPDPVQTLSFTDTSIVFFAVDADTATSGGIYSPANIVPAIGLGEPDLTEAQLEAGAKSPLGNDTYPFIRDEIDMNVSTSGIGVGNNVLQGQDLPGDAPGTINPYGSGAFDESFVINPEPLASSIKVYVSKTAGGFAPPGSGATPAKTDYLYWNLYDELGNNSGPNLVNFADVTDEGSLWSFTIDVDNVPNFGDFIDAAQFTMGFGDIKIVKIEIEVRGNEPPNDILLDFQSTLTDGDGDKTTSDFAINLFGYEPTVNPDEFDYILQGGTLGSSPEAFNALDQADPLNDYLIQGFDTNEDKLVLNNLAGGAGSFTLQTGLNLFGNDGLNDSLVTSNNGTLSVTIANATLQASNIVIG